MFKWKRTIATASEPTTPTYQMPANPRQRLTNLEKAHARRLAQLRNPNLPESERPEITARLADISAEIRTLRQAIQW